MTLTSENKKKFKISASKTLFLMTHGFCINVLTFQFGPFLIFSWDRYIYKYIYLLNERDVTFLKTFLFPFRSPLIFFSFFIFLLNLIFKVGFKIHASYPIRPPFYNIHIPPFFPPSIIFISPFFPPSFISISPLPPPLPAFQVITPSKA